MSVNGTSPLTRPGDSLVRLQSLVCDWCGSFFYGWNDQFLTSEDRVRIGFAVGLEDIINGHVVFDGDDEQCLTFLDDMLAGTGHRCGRAGRQNQFLPHEYAIGVVNLVHLLQ